jgi:hypothetical protein
LREGKIDAQPSIIKKKGKLNRRQRFNRNAKQKGKTNATKDWLCFDRLRSFLPRLKAALFRTSPMASLTCFP